MARKVTEIEINSETTREDLELCAHAADRSSDPQRVRIAADGRAEKYRRRRQEELDDADVQSRERVHTLTAQAAMVDRQIEAQAALMERQLEVAREQASAARDAAVAATQSAGATRWIAAATMALAAATFFLVAVTAAPLVREWFSAPAVEEAQPPATTEEK